MNVWNYLIIESVDHWMIGLLNHWINGSDRISVRGFEWPPCIIMLMNIITNDCHYRYHMKHEHERIFHIDHGFYYISFILNILALLNNIPVANCNNRTASEMFWISKTTVSILKGSKNWMGQVKNVVLLNMSVNWLL